VTDAPVLAKTSGAKNIKPESLIFLPPMFLPWSLLPNLINTHLRATERRTAGNGGKKTIK
jgi:hypothetical protein